MSQFFSSSTGILTMVAVTMAFILTMMGYMFWKFIKLSNHKPQPGEKAW